jgi:hypothetical protein
MRMSCACAASLLLFADAGTAADLKPASSAAFDRYVAVVERRIATEVARPETFLWADTLPPARRTEVVDRLRRGEVVTERLRIPQKIEVPEALIHHWVGTIYIRGAEVGDVVALLKDYDRHATVFSPNVVQSHTLEHRAVSARTLEDSGDYFRVFLRFYMKKVVAATLNTEHEAHFVTAGQGRVYSAIHSTRIAEVENAGTPDERELQPGQGHGFMWRLNTYWHFLERDGGTYVQCESLTLSRDVPFGLGWIIKPFVTEIPMESLTFTLQHTRAALTEGVGSVPRPGFEVRRSDDEIPYVFDRRARPGGHRSAVGVAAR